MTATTLSSDEERIKRLNDRILKRQKEVEEDRAELKRIEKLRREQNEKILRREKEKWRTDASRALLQFYPIPVTELVAILEAHAGQTKP